MLLSVKDLEVFYGKIQALRGVSLEVSEGEVVTILGANGAGKTSILKAISGLVPVARGSIEFEGKAIGGVSPEAVTRLQIAHVPEGRGIFGDLSVAENLKLGTYARRDKRDLKDDYDLVMECFPVLREREDQMGGTLSGGEQQMLTIGRALLLHPKLLMIDEPSLGLAPLLVKGLYEVLAKLSKEGVTMLLVEQNARQALGLADRGYVVELGQVVLSGTAAALRDNDDVKRAYLTVTDVRKSGTKRQEWRLAHGLGGAALDTASK